MQKSPSAAQLLACAHKLADAAGKAIRPHFRKSLVVENKAGHAAFDPVTAADQAAEKAIARALKATFPEHGMIGEEFGETNPAARYKWIIDPIDGTRSFIMGLPTWGTLIALLDGETPVLGMMDQPFTGERYYSIGKETRLRMDGTSRRLSTRSCEHLSEAVLSSTHPDLFESSRERKVLARLKSQARMTRFGGDCYAYCLLAAGHIDVIVEPGLKAYDIAAIVPIIERAGGRVTTWTGHSAALGGDIVATGDPRLHDEVLDLLASK